MELVTLAGRGGGGRRGGRDAEIILLYFFRVPFRSGGMSTKARFFFFLLDLARGLSGGGVNNPAKGSRDGERGRAD
jgi:hypothetical protein